MAVRAVWAATSLHPFCLEQVIKGIVYSPITFFFQAERSEGWHIPKCNMQGLREKDVWDGSVLTRWLHLAVLGVLKGSEGEIKAAGLCLRGVSVKGRSVCALHLSGSTGQGLSTPCK